MEVEPTTRAGLRISLNGQKRTTNARTLAELLAESGFGGAKIATAVNGEFVPERARNARPLAEGDKVEIVSPRQGG